MELTAAAVFEDDEADLADGIDCTDWLLVARLFAVDGVLVVGGTAAARRLVVVGVGVCSAAGATDGVLSKVSECDVKFVIIVCTSHLS